MGVMAAPGVAVEMAAMVLVAVVAMDSVMANATSLRHVQRKANQPQHRRNKRRRQNVKDAMNHVRHASQEKHASRVHHVTPTPLQLHQALQHQPMPMRSAHPKPKAKAVEIGRAHV